MTRKEVNKIVKEVYSRIEDEYGLSKFQICTPYIEVHKNIYAKYSGIEDADGEESPEAEYDSDENTIYLYYPKMKSKRHIVETILHEYRHYLQSPIWMERYYKMGYEYSNHPYELQAIEEEKNWKYFVN